MSEVYHDQNEKFVLYIHRLTNFHIDTFDIRKILFECLRLMKKSILKSYKISKVRAFWIWKPH